MVCTACHGSNCSLGVTVESEALSDGSLQILMAFPYGSPDITASDFGCPDWHSSKILMQDSKRLLICRVLDWDGYYVYLNSKKEVLISQDKPHNFILSASENHITFTVAFSKEAPQNIDKFDQLLENSRNTWKNFWEKGGMIELHKSKDPRALELERRIVLSQYLSAIQSCGSMPPQETGLILIFNKND